MPDTLKRLSGPTALTTSAVTQYTVPAVTTTAVRTVIVCNTTSGALNFTLSIGADAAGTRLFDSLTIDPFDTWEYNGLIVLNTTEILQAKGSATGLTLTMSGVEIT